MQYVCVLLLLLFLLIIERGKKRRIVRATNRTYMKYMWKKAEIRKQERIKPYIHNTYLVIVCTL